MSFFKGKRVLVTGGAGLVGAAFVQQLIEQGAFVRSVIHSRPLPFSDVEIVSGDLRDRSTCERACAGMDAVVHAAGVSGGSKNVILRGIEMFTDSLLMAIEVMEAARIAGVSHYLLVSNSSVYARSDLPLRESEAWGETSVGFPENETGMVKRAAETQCLLYSKTTQMSIAIERGGNAYGPFDNFDLESSHVVPALIRKAVERQDPYRVWGSGATVRDFIHTTDLARGGLCLLERAQPGLVEPVNIATGRAVRINELVDRVLEAAGHSPSERVLDSTAPPASAVKQLDVTRMRDLGFQPKVELEQGLRQTIEWYRSQR